MRTFEDGEGRSWTADIRAETGTDYKGRWFLVMRSADGEVEAPLRDVRWNSERTAVRTLETMSVVELRRRLRSALGRASAPIPR